ncbi:TonB-dependent receptor domain-containing protein [Paremcibacter congregatus]|nr:TonB-dependent receptor [Paremcibacter congregatus]
MKKNYKYSLVSVLALTAAMVTVPAQATQSYEAKALEMARQPLNVALQQLSDKFDVQIASFSEDLSGKTVRKLSGTYNLQDALTVALAGSGLYYLRVDDRTIAVGTSERLSTQYQKVGFKVISSNTASDYEANLAPYQDDEKLDGVDSMLFDEIIVTASRREQNLQDVPMSVAVVRPEEFTSAGLTRLKDIVAYTPGVTVSDTAGSSVNGTITARGVAKFGNAGGTATVGIYLDTVPLTSNGPHGTGGSFAFDGLLGDIERIEFLKGPQGTLYGSTSVGGAVKYITRKPSLNEFRGHAAADLSSTKEGGFNQIYNGRISVPIVEDKLGITVAGFYEDNGGFVDRVDGAGALLQKDSDTYDRYGFSGDIYFQVSDRLSLRGRALHQKATYHGLSHIDIDAATKVPTYDKFATDFGFSNRNLKSTFYAGTIEYQFDGATLTSTTSYVESAAHTDQETVSLFGFFVPTATTIPLVDDLGIEKFSQEIQLSSDSSETWEWMLGLYYANEETFGTQSALAQPGDILVYGGQSPSDYIENAVFGNLTYYITPEFDVSVGGRLSRNQMEFTNIAPVSFFSPVADEFNSSVKDTINTWSFGLRYRPSDDLSLYARVASGYRPAFANRLVADGMGNELPRFVNADTLWSYELGAKGSMADGVLSYDIALWYIDWADFQTTINLDPAGFFGGLGNVDGGITIKGVEGSVILKPVDGLSVISNFAYTDSTLNDDEANINGTSGQQLPYVPKWTFSSRAIYDFALTADLDAHVGAGVRYEDSTRSAFTDGDGGSSNIQSDSYVVVDLSAGVNWDRFSLNLYATNLFNEYALISTASAFVSTGVPLKPRTIGARLSVDF